VWSAEETATFLAAAATDRYHAVYVLALSSGLRQGEILALRWRDIGKGAVRVRGTLVRKTRTVADPKTETSRRNVAVSSNVIDALEAHRARQQAKGHPTGPDDFVFTAKSKRPVGVKNLYHHSFVPLMEAAEVPRISFHALRHTNASLLLDAGVNIKVIQERLGQRDAALLLKRYAHLMPAAHAAAADKIADIFAPPPSPRAPRVRGNVRGLPVANDAKSARSAKLVTERKSTTKRSRSRKKAEKSQ
jgi:integrase